MMSETIIMSMEMFEKIISGVECIVQTRIIEDRNCDDDCITCYLEAIKKDNEEKGIE